ncbi:hypothetical protein GWN26_09505, partial [Candidatus Saccharibacteria bacterium]|nr:hypothetical protein [Candidatus Saccharibacteria bacterium]NIW78616.1 hypothetical protein [Calditrichia bacterium]
MDNEQLATKQFSYNADTIDAIVKFLQKRKEGDRTITSGEIEPFQLQLLCQHIEKMIYEKQKQVVGKTKEQIRVRKEDLGGEPGMQKVLQNFYEDEIKSLTPPPARKAARKLCEAGL